MTDVVIRAENLSKLYRIGELQLRTTLRESIVAAARGALRPSARRPAETVWALKDVSFEIGRGEVVGIIGRNGAGKSTLLKVLARITEPTSGRAEVRGRVGSLLEVGTGFHSELTGRENIFLSGAILGMRRAEIVRRFDEIVAFAEVERFVDTPVKHYSTGMYLRLAFAVAAHLEPEILLVDEVLAVGDAAFQKKCLGKMGDVSRQGRTVLFVSHNLAAVRYLCPSTLWLEGGGVHLHGPSEAVVREYLESTTAGGTALWTAEAGANDDRRASLLRVAVTDEGGRVAEMVGSDRPFFVEIDYRLADRVEGVRVGYRLQTPDGLVVFTSADTDPDGWGTDRGPGVLRSRCVFPGKLLNGGRYLLSVGCDVPMREILFFHEAVAAFNVQVSGSAGGAIPDGRLGLLRPSLDWSVAPVADTDRGSHARAGELEGDDAARR
ncbi:MAG: ABC transporter ATP-binding protein [Acidobacteria bacterium]|nr:ABC transporter ATP-binding protein [Acidobacteriota bacterium]